jgi:hypothetical protein
VSEKHAIRENAKAHVHLQAKVVPVSSCTEAARDFSQHQSFVKVFAAPLRLLMGTAGLQVIEMKSVSTFAADWI